MYYKLVELRRSYITKELMLEVSNVEGDRQKNEECFNLAGFYYCHATKSDKEIIAEFKQKMQEHWKAQISNFENLISQLDTLVDQHNATLT